MSLIDGSYFRNDIIIPGILESGSYTDEIKNFITKYESEVLTDLLGYELYKLLQADLDESGNPQTQRFIDLINGAEFTHPDSRQLLKWIGFKNTQKESLIAYYVYFNYVYYKETELSKIGTIRSKLDNSNRVSPFDKLQNAWERFYRLYSGFDFETIEIYFSEEGLEVNELPGCFNVLPSAYNFLYANKDDYPEWIFTVKYDKNIFSL